MIFFFAGMFSLVAFIVITMTVPFIRYLKRDLTWNALSVKTPEVWYCLS